MYPVVLAVISLSGFYTFSEYIVVHFNNKNKRRGRLIRIKF